VRAESEERRVILLAEELERRGVLPRVDGVVPAEVLCVRLLQAEEVRQQLIDDSGRLLAAGEQRGARVFDELGLALREEATTAGRFCAPALEAHEREVVRWWLSGAAVGPRTRRLKVAQGSGSYTPGRVNAHFFSAL